MIHYHQVKVTILATSGACIALKSMFTIMSNIITDLEKNLERLQEINDSHIQNTDKDKTTPA
jgi:hypothetical protein